MDGLPAMHVAQKTMLQERIEPLKKMVGPLAPTRYQNGNRFGVEHLVLVAVMTAIITAILMSFGADTARAVAVRLPASPSRLIHSPLGTMT